MLAFDNTLYLYTFLHFIGHHCEDTNCKRTLILDGNMKNHRDICAARHAGFAEYEGLPGNVKTGCPNTPLPRTRYCAAHVPTAFSSVVSGECSSTTSGHGLHQVAFIIEKKTTRQNSFYKVRAYTWQASFLLCPNTCIINYI